MSVVSTQEPIYTAPQSRGSARGWRGRWLSFYPECKIRVVGHGDVGGEYWSIYTIVPREYLLRELRKFKHRGFTAPRSIDELLDLLPQVGPAAPRRYESYSGPGQFFCTGTSLWRRNRRYYVFYTSGGLDI